MRLTLNTIAHSALARCALLLLAAAQVGAAEYNPVRTKPAVAPPVEHRFIVKMRAATTDSTRLQAQAVQNEAAVMAAATERVKSLASRAHVTLSEDRGLTPMLHVMHVTSQANETEEQELARLRADSEVEYAVQDRRVFAHAVPTDPGYSGQWFLQATQPSAINATAAWDVSTGSNGIVIADIDTGVRFDHPDIRRASQGGRFLPGYDFVSPDSSGVFKTANDGDGRDTDASDPGDWVTAADNCGTAENSSWHGTRVSGIIGAMTNNGVGVAGITWKGWILPVRVLGKCGGFNSDVLAGMLWAAGQHVNGVPDNPYPAEVLNISLGGTGSCDSASADVTSTLASQGVLIVVSAGNEGGPVDSPANCPGAMGILGLRQAGTKVGFSSLGPEIKLAAPGGNCVNTTAGSPCLYSLDTTTNLGSTTPTTNGYTDQFNTNLGTSFSAPIVSGVVGLMLSVNSNLKSTQLIARLQEGASPFPTTSENPGVPVCHTPASATDIQSSECICTTAVCGAGMANALGAVTAALRPIAAIAVPSTVTAGQNVSLQGGGSAAACNHSISTYAWSVVTTSGGATAPTIVNPNSANALVPAPTAGTVTVRLTVTDDAGKQDSATVVISTTGTTTSAPSNAGSTACPTDIVVPQEQPQVSVTATDASASEPGTDTGTFTFTRTGDASTALTAAIVLSGSAANGTDYQTLGSSITFAAGLSTATLTVTPIDNSKVDGSRTVVVTIQSGSGYAVGSPSNATVTIADNDVAASNASSGGGGGGGGGSLDALVLMGLALAVLAALVRAGHLPRYAKQFRKHVAAEERRSRR